MNNKIYLNQTREEAIAPLLDFGVMYVSDLYKLSRSTKAKTSFYRLILRMEKDGLLISKKHTDKNKKYVYLSKDVHDTYAPDLPYVSGDILYHDAVLASILCKFSRLNISSLCIKMHQGVSLNRFASGVFPDGIVFTESNEVKKKVAIEVELTRKSKDRYLRKFDLYMKEDEIDVVIFFFDSKGVYNSYKRELKLFLHENDIKKEDCKIALCHVGSVSEDAEDFFSSVSYGLGRECLLHNLFGLDSSNMFKEESTNNLQAEVLQ